MFYLFDLTYTFLLDCDEIHIGSSSLDAYNHVGIRVPLNMSMFEYMTADTANFHGDMNFRPLELSMLRTLLHLGPKALLDIRLFAIEFFDVQAGSAGVAPRKQAACATFRYGLKYTFQYSFHNGSFFVAALTPRRSKEVECTSRAALERFLLLFV